MKFENTLNALPYDHKGLYIETKERASLLNLTHVPTQKRSFYAQAILYEQHRTHPHGVTTFPIRPTAHLRFLHTFLHLSQDRTHTTKFKGKNATPIEPHTIQMS